MMERPIALVLLTLAQAGCTAWQSTDPDIGGIPRLPKTRMSPDSVGIEIATVTLDSTNFHLLAAILLELDEQVLPPEKRRHLADNGFRGGVLGNQLPFAIQFLLEEAADRRQRPTADSMLELPDQQRFVQCRAGRRVGVGLWAVKPTLGVQHRRGHEVSEDLFDHASCQIAIRCQPNAADGAVVALTPEIEYGVPRQQFVVADESFHIESKRERKVYDDLLMQFSLRPGEVLLLTCTQASDLVGQHVFRNAESTKQKLLLVRLAQTQIDISFDEGI